MSVVRKKQDDKYLKALRELVTTGSGNRQCFDCGQKGPTYVNMTIGSFVCTRCSGVLRGLTPPHRVKSISMATFTQEELDFLKAHGNDLCGKTWLGLWDPKRAVHQDHRELMIDKYERKRYYLEPASPLKSLTNAVSLKTNNSTSTQNNKNSSSSSNDNNNPHITPLTNGFGSDHNKPQQNAIDNSFQNIQFTTPTSQRTTANGLHKSSTSAISRPQHQQQQQNGFNHHQQDAFMLNNSAALLNGLNASSAASTGALSDTSSCASHGFGPEGDFVADFGSANIFDATSAGSVGSPTVSSSASSVASSNGYAKIQSIKAAHQLMNGHANSKQHQLSGANSSSNGNTENFADFDHAPIFNAAGLPMPKDSNSSSSTVQSGHSFNKNNNNEDRYAALKDLDEQLRESKAVASAASSIVASAVVDSFAHNNNNNLSSAGTANPFKSQQQQSQQQQQQSGAMVNPFQAAHNTQQQNIYGQMTVLPNGIGATNGFGQYSQSPTQQHQQQQSQAAAGFFNYNNGFTTVSGAAATSMFPTASGPNGCGFGFGAMQQQIAATGGGMGSGLGGAFNNPFAATNSNNPFL